MIKVFLSRPNWVPRHIENHLVQFDEILRKMGMEAYTIGTNVVSLLSPFNEVVALMKQCDCTIVLGIPQIKVREGEIKESKIEHGFALPTEWNQIEAAISIMLNKPTLMMLHRGVANHGLFERGAANVFIHEFDTSGLLKTKWFEKMIPKLEALKAKVEELKRM